MVNMTEDEFTRCIQSYEDRGYWAAAGHWFWAGVLASLIIVMPLVVFGVSSGIFIGIQQK